MKENQIISIEIEKIEPTTQNIKLNSLKLYLSLEIEELIKEKQGKEIGKNLTMNITEQELNKLYFNFVERIERQKDYYFPEDLDD